MLDVELSSQQKETLINTPWICWISPIPTDEAINYRAIPQERGMSLISPLVRGLTGAGMTVGIGDGGRVNP